MRAWIYDHALQIAGAGFAVVTALLSAFWPEPWSLYVALQFGLAQ